MKFADLLREYIGDRTLESVVAECKARGVDIDRLYLGRLRSGNRLPPEDDNITRTIALVCGRDPEPLLLLARYERSPHEVMQEIVEAFVLADNCALHLQEHMRIPLTVLAARLEAGEDVPKEDILNAVKAEDPFVERLREAYHRYRDRAFEIIELITDWNRLSKLGERVGAKGTFEEVWNLPEGTQVAIRSVEPIPTKGRRLRELIVRLSEVAGVPEGPIVAAIAAAKAVQDPDFSVNEFVQSLQA